MTYTSRLIATLAACVLLASSGGVRGQEPAPIQFVFTSDAHYGLTRMFRGRANTPASTVNRAMIRAINGLPRATFPRDGGLRGQEPVGAIDFVAEGGDIANREEGAGAAAIQTASASWSQFASDYVHGLTVIDRSGQPSPLFVVPGNHEASNVVGFYRQMTPATDASAYTSIYNLMMKPTTAVTPASFDYARHKVLTSRDIGGIHFQFISIWPDSDMRRWMDEDLRRVPPSTPVIVFAHDQPEVEAKHFRNPNGAHDVNARDQFENLLADVFTSGTTVDAVSTNEQRALERFLRSHPNVTAYFHGNSNWNQFYDWVGPDHSARLHTFRVDSPMKGAVSAMDETKLSFQIAVLDPVSRRLTVREVLWNATRDAAVRWGGSVTVALEPRPSPPELRQTTTN